MSLKELAISNKIETHMGGPEDYYLDEKNIALKDELYALMQGFVF